MQATVDKMKKVKIHIKIINEYGKLAVSKAIKISIKKKNLYFAESKKYDIYSVGLSKHEAIDEFCKQFAYFYIHYVNTNNEKLNENAIKLKRLYIDLFEMRI